MEVFQMGLKHVKHMHKDVPVKPTVLCQLVQDTDSKIKGVDKKTDKDQATGPLGQAERFVSEKKEQELKVVVWKQAQWHIN